MEHAGKGFGKCFGDLVVLFLFSYSLSLALVVKLKEHIYMEPVTDFLYLIYVYNIYNI